MKKLFSSILSLFLIFSLTTSSLAADNSPDISPYGFGTETFRYDFMIDIPEDYDKTIGYNFPAGTVDYYIYYRVSYDLNSGKIKSVSITSEGLSEYQNLNLRHVNILYATNLSTGCTISPDNYSVIFNLNLAGEITYYNPLDSKSPYKVDPIRNLRTGAVTVTPPTT